LKARKELKEMTKARDIAEAGLAGTQKQAEDQTRRLLDAEDQLKIANEQIIDLKKKLAKAEWAKDEALRAKAEAEFARTEAESSKEKAKEEAYDLGVAETQATLKAQVPKVCRLYCSQVWNEVLKQARLRLHPICGRWRMYTTLRPSVKLPLPAPRLRLLLRRLRLLGLKLLWP